MARKRHDEGPAPGEGESPARAVSPEAASPKEKALDVALRPTHSRSSSGAQGGREPGGLCGRSQEARRNSGSRASVWPSWPRQDHPAHLLAHEMGTQARVTSGPALERKGDLAGILTSLSRGDVLFVDEIHRLQPIIEESLYPAMEDFKIEIVTGVGAAPAPSRCPSNASPWWAPPRAPAN